MPKMYSRVTLSEKMCMHWSIHSGAHVVPVLPRLKTSGIKWTKRLLFTPETSNRFAYWIPDCIALNLTVQDETPLKFKVNRHDWKHTIITL